MKRKLLFFILLISNCLFAEGFKNLGWTTTKWEMQEQAKKRKDVKEIKTLSEMEKIFLGTNADNYFLTKEAVEKDEVTAGYFFRDGVYLAMVTYIIPATQTKKHTKKLGKPAQTYKAKTNMSTYEIVNIMGSENMSVDNLNAVLIQTAETLFFYDFGGSLYSQGAYEVPEKNTDYKSAFNIYKPDDFTNVYVLENAFEGYTIITYRNWL